MRAEALASWATPHPPAWVGNYIGLPFKEHGRDRAGLDCWGLVKLVLAEQWGIEVPSYTDRYSDVTDPAQLGPLIEGERARLLLDRSWRQLELGLTPLQPGDLLIVRIMGAAMHCGLAVTPHRMLHIEQGIDAALADLRESKWRHRLAPAPFGAYRHASRD